jgi:hypothetical protein
MISLHSGYTKGSIKGKVLLRGIKRVHAGPDFPVPSITLSRGTLNEAADDASQFLTFLLLRVLPCEIVEVALRK